MDLGESSPHQRDDSITDLSLPCDACETALQSPDRHRLSFLLLDQLTTPVIGCDEHVAQFASICGYTTEATAELIDHRPAGGVGCPSYHLTPYNPHQPILPVEDGAVGILACPEHQSELLNRFHTGLETQRQITTELTTSERPYVP